MRAKEIISRITEARRNPHLNPKRSGRIEAAQFLSEIMSAGEYWGVSFTEINKLGINPATSFSTGALNAATPAGVYFYPAKYFINTVIDSIPFPFADTLPYIQVFNYKPKKTLHLNKTTAKEFWRISDLLGVSEEVSEGWGPGVMATVHEFVKQNPGPTSETWELHRVFRKLGYDSILDLGTGFIQSNEPYCGVILDTSIIKERRMFRNIQPKGTENLPKDEQPIPAGKYLDPEEAFLYARDVINGRWYAAEPTIAQDPEIAHNYATLFIGFGKEYDQWIQDMKIHS